MACIWTAILFALSMSNVHAMSRISSSRPFRELRNTQDRHTSPHRARHSWEVHTMLVKKVRAQCMPLTNLQCQGNDLPDQWPPANTPSAEECAMLCMQEGDCHAYTWNHGDNGTQGDITDAEPQCWLKYDCPDPHPDPKATSGICLNASFDKNESIPDKNESFPKSVPENASASGDPHLSNIRGERFDIYKLGQMEFIRVPLESATEDANLTVHASVQDVLGSSDSCSQTRYITSLVFSGAWLENRKLEVSMHRGEMVVLLGGVRVKPSARVLPMGSMLQLHVPDEDQFHVSAGQMSIDVSRDRRPVHFFLNIEARSLAALQCKIGGLLGEDDHADVSTPPSGCRQTVALTQVTSEQGDGSRASASQ